MDARGDQTGYMSDIDQQDRSDVVADLAEPGKINDAGISGRAGDDHF